MTNHQPLHWLLTNSKLSGKLARWALILSEYDLDIVHRAGRVHCNADCLSRNPVSDEIDQTEARHDQGPMHLAPSACMAYLAVAMHDDVYLDDILYGPIKDEWLHTDWMAAAQQQAALMATAPDSSPPTTR